MSAALIEPPLHRPRPCPACAAQSWAIVDGRCLRCRTDPADLEPAAPARPAWRPTPQVTVERPMPNPGVCAGCGEESWAMAEGHCMACRHRLGMDVA